MQKIEVEVPPILRAKICQTEKKKNENKRKSYKIFAQSNVLKNAGGFSGNEQP